MQNIVLINNSMTICPTKIAVPFFSFFNNLLHDAYNIFQKGIDKF